MRLITFILMHNWLDQENITFCVLLIGGCSANYESIASQGQLTQEARNLDKSKSTSRASSAYGEIQLAPVIECFSLAFEVVSPRPSSPTLTPAFPFFKAPLPVLCFSS